MLCKFCGKPAGLFSRVHKQCDLAHLKAVACIPKAISTAITSSSDFSALKNDVTSLAANGYVNPNELNNLYVSGFDNAVEAFLDDGVISKEEEDKISSYKNYFDLDQSTLDRNGSFQKVAKGLIINDIIQGKLPENRLSISGNMPFLLEKGEVIIWVFQNVEFYEQRTKTTFEGRSQGVSIKIAKGEYYRTGSFKGNPVTNTQMTLIGDGMLGLTNKNIYFASASKSFKTPFSKLISLSQYSDGIGIQKNGTTAKPQILKGLDGWFTYNVISNLRNS